MSEVIANAAALPPVFPPPWAVGWGEDVRGVFAEVLLAEAEVRDVTLELRWIPPGRFFMGSPDGEAGRDVDEGPRHEVTISRGFWLGATPVTQAQWLVVMGNAPSRFAGKNDSGRRPVERVSWTECGEFCAKVNALAPGLGARLPSEAEWEYAGRAGTESAFNDGSACEVGKDGTCAPLEKLGWYGGNSRGETHPVGLKKANGWGLRDMHGNVWEWCADGKRAYAKRAEIDPLGPMESDHRVIRGGSWDLSPRCCRSAYRSGFGPGDRLGSVGFRLATGQELRRAESGAVDRAGAGRK